jgi:hypothetical protein
VLIAATAAALAAAAPAHAQRFGSCNRAGTRTLLSTSIVRVFYDRRARPFGCWRPSGRRTALDQFVDRYYAPGDARVGLRRLAGEVLGYTWIDPGVPVVYVHSVNLRRGRYRRRAALTTTTEFEPSSVAVTDLVVRGNGALAWIQRLEGEVSVWRYDRRGKRRLDARPGISVRSLGLRRGRLVWRRSAALRSASIL